MFCFVFLFGVFQGWWVFATSITHCATGRVPLLDGDSEWLFAADKALTVEFRDLIRGLERQKHLHFDGNITAPSAW